MVIPRGIRAVLPRLDWLTPSGILHRRAVEEARLRIIASNRPGVGKSQFVGASKRARGRT